MKKYLLLLLFPVSVLAQDDLLNEIDTVSTEKSKVESAFKGLKIINLESTKLAAKGDLYFIVAHRFGSIKDGFEGFYGLDNANTQIKFVYGLTNWFTVSGARSELAYDFSGKILIKNQEREGFPFAIVGFGSIGLNNTLKESLYPNMTFENRLIYVSQILISRKLSENLSLQLSPTFFHENFVLDDNQENSQLAVGLGGRYKFAKRWSLNIDYAAHLNRATNSPYKNPLSVGVDIETGGHVFQMHFSSSQGIHEAGFLGNTTGDWTKGDVFFGFNLLRVF